MCNIKMTETLNNSITIHGAKNDHYYLSGHFKTVLFYCLASWPYSDEKKHRSIVWRTVENIGNADRILKV